MTGPSLDAVRRVGTGTGLALFSVLCRPCALIAPPTRTRFARRHPKAYLWIHGFAGLGLSAACVWIFFAIAEDVPEGGRMVRTDAAITSWLQSHGTEWGESIFVGVSYLGAQVLIATLVIIAVVFIGRRDWSRLELLAVACLGGAILNAALKTIFHRSRPEFAAEFHVRSWSFPSAHAMNSLIAYGLLAYWLAHRNQRARHWIFAAAVVLVAAVGYARIYLGVHYLSDVVAGYAAGATWLAVCITGSQFAERRGMT